MTSERSKRRDFLSLIFISKSISKKLLMKCMYFRNFTTLFVKYSYLYFSSYGVYGSKVKKRNKLQYVN